jgi:hypothetical protein
MAVVGEKPMAIDSPRQNVAGIYAGATRQTRLREGSPVVIGGVFPRPEPGCVQ